MGLPCSDPEELRDAANGDPEFKHAARFWTCGLRLEAGSSGVTLRITDGHVASIEPEPTDEWDLRIAAPESDWSALLEEVPRPFYQDLYGAVTHHDFELSGDLEGQLHPYYPAVRRLMELLREQHSA